MLQTKICEVYCGYIFNLQVMVYSFHANICSPFRSVHGSVLEAVQFMEVEASLEEVNPPEACCEARSSILLPALSLLPALLWWKKQGVQSSAPVALKSPAYSLILIGCIISNCELK